MFGTIGMKSKTGEKIQLFKVNDQLVAVRYGDITVADLYLGEETFDMETHGTPYTEFDVEQCVREWKKVRLSEGRAMARIRIKLG